MQITSFVSEAAIIPSLDVATRDECIAVLVKRLEDTGAFAPEKSKEVLDAIMRREHLGSTGIGRGIAIPHSRHSAVNTLVGALALCRKPGGINFESIDGEPVDVVVLMISPQEQPGPHLRALDCVVKTFKEDATLNQLRACTTTQDIWATLSAAE